MTFPLVTTSSKLKAGQLEETRELKKSTSSASTLPSMEKLVWSMKQSPIWVTRLRPWLDCSGNDTRIGSSLSSRALLHLVRKRNAYRGVSCSEYISTEYGEWLSNLNTKFAPVGSHINGFKRVHKGFKCVTTMISIRILAQT